MKLKRILAGFMTAAMVVTSVPVSGLGTITAFAADTETLTEISSDAMTATADCNSDASDVPANALVEAGKWHSAYNGENQPEVEARMVANNHIFMTVEGKFHTLWGSESGTKPTVERSLIGKNNFYITLNEAKNLKKLEYYTAQNNGAIKNANVYVSNAALEESQTAADITDWTKVYDGSTDWPNHTTSSDARVVTFAEAQTAKYVRIEAVHTYGDTTDKFISAKQFKLYAVEATEPQPDEKAAAVEALKTALTDDIKAAGASDGSAYTEATWNAFKAAYDTAAAYAAEDADLTEVTAEQITAAKDAVAAAGLRDYVPRQTEEIPVNPDVTVAAPTAGQAVPSGLATLTSSSISSNVATLVPGDNFETGEDGAVRGRITDANPNDPDSIFNVTGTTKLLFRMKIKSDAPAENGIQSLIGKMNDQYGVQMEKSGDTTRIYFYAKLVPAKWAEASYTIQADYDWSQWHDLVTYYDGSALHLWVDGNAETSNRNLTGELQNCADAVFTLGYNYAPKQDNQTLAAGWDYSGWMKDIGLYIGEHVPELNIISEMDAAAVTAAFDTALAGATSDFVLSGEASSQEDYMEVTATTWTPATGTVSPYEDYAVSVELTAKEGYYFGENAAATLRTSAANVLTGATVTVSDAGSAMTINYTFEGEEHPQVTLQNYLASEEFTAIGNENVGENGKRKYTKDSWNAYAEKAAAAVEKAYNNNLEPAAYTTARTELAAAIAALELAAEHCECTLSDITGFEGTTLDLQGSTEMTVTLGTGEYTYSNGCVKHENATPAVSYALVGNPAGATLTGNVLKVTQPGIVQVRFTVTLGDQTKSATATYTVVKTATAEQKDALTKAIKEVEDKYVANADKYTADSWKKLDDALKAAKALGDNASADQVVAATKAVNDAIAGLVLAGPTDLDVAKEAVNKALTAADAIYAAGQKDYTDATWKAFADAYQAAKAAPANADAAALNALAAALTKAQAALAKNATTPKKPGDQIEAPDGSRYEVVDPNAKTAKLVKVKSKKATKLNVPATVKLQGETYKVTGVGKNVMSKNKKLTKVILGKNVTTIETKAFYGCTKLKTVQLKGKALKKVGKQAFKKTYAKMVVSAKKMNKKEKAKLLKTMRKAGMSKKGKVK